MTGERGAAGKGADRLDARERRAQVRGQALQRRRAAVRRGRDHQQRPRGRARRRQRHARRPPAPDAGLDSGACGTAGQPQARPNLTLTLSCAHRLASAAARTPNSSGRGGGAPPTRASRTTAWSPARPRAPAAAPASAPRAARGAAGSRPAGAAPPPPPPGAAAARRAVSAPLHRSQRPAASLPALRPVAVGADHATEPERSHVRRGHGIPYQGARPWAHQAQRVGLRVGLGEQADPGAARRQRRQVGAVRRRAARRAQRAHERPLARARVLARAALAPRGLFRARAAPRQGGRERFGQLRFPRFRPALPGSFPLPASASWLQLARFQLQ